MPSETDLSRFPDLVFNAVVYGMGFTNESWATQLRDPNLGPVVGKMVEGYCTFLQLALFHGDNELLVTVAQQLEAHRTNTPPPWSNSAAQFAIVGTRLREKPGGLLRTA